MIENTLWMTYFEYLPIELKQAEEEGKNVELYRKEIEEIIQTSGDMSFEEKERKAWEILDRIEKEPIKREFPYQEPNEIEKIEDILIKYFPDENYTRKVLENAYANNGKKAMIVSILSVKPVASPF